MEEEKESERKTDRDRLQQNKLPFFDLLQTQQRDRHGLSGEMGSSEDPDSVGLRLSWRDFC